MEPKYAGKSTVMQQGANSAATPAIKAANKDDPINRFINYSQQELFAARAAVLRTGVRFGAFAAVLEAGIKHPHHVIAEDQRENKNVNCAENEASRVQPCKSWEHFEEFVMQFYRACAP